MQTKQGSSNQLSNTNFTLVRRILDDKTKIKKNFINSTSNSYTLSLTIIMALKASNTTTSSHHGNHFMIFKNRFLFVCSFIIIFRYGPMTENLFNLFRDFIMHVAIYERRLIFRINFPEKTFFFKKKKLFPNFTEKSIEKVHSRKKKTIFSQK